MKFDDGMKAEREIFTNLMFTPECVSLRHLFIAERASVEDPGRAGRHQGRDIKRSGVIGRHHAAASHELLNAGFRWSCSK